MISQVSRNSTTQGAGGRSQRRASSVTNARLRAMSSVSPAGRRRRTAAIRRSVPWATVSGVVKAALPGARVLAAPRAAWATTRAGSEGRSVCSAGAVRSRRYCSRARSKSLNGAVGEASWAASAASAVSMPWTSVSSMRAVRPPARRAVSCHWAISVDLPMPPTPRTWNRKSAGSGPASGSGSRPRFSANSASWARRPTNWESTRRRRASARDIRRGPRDTAFPPPPPCGPRYWAAGSRRPVIRRTARRPRTARCP